MNWCRKMALAGREECGRIFAIPNGGLRSKTEAARMKAAGVTAGVPDLFLPVVVEVNQENYRIGGIGNGPSRYFPGLWIELKEPGKGKVSPEQNKWLLALMEQGYEARVAYGWEEAVEIVKGYLGPLYGGGRNGEAAEWPEVDLGAWANGILGK